jgi:hypothetical protein
MVVYHDRLLMVLSQALQVKFVQVLTHVVEQLQRNFNFNKNIYKGHPFFCFFQLFMK